MASPSDKQADLALMQRIASGEESAVAELYDRFGSLVFRLAYQSMPTRDEAEDAVQEVFVRLWKTADRYDPSRAALVTWGLADHPSAPGRSAAPGPVPDPSDQDVRSRPSARHRSG